MTVYNQTGHYRELVVGTYTHHIQHRQFHIIQNGDSHTVSGENGLIMEIVTVVVGCSERFLKLMVQITRGSI